MRSATRRRALQSEDENVEADIEQCRRLIAPSVRRRAEQFAEAAGLQQASSQFQKEIIEAILWCTVTHALAPSSKRVSATRKVFQRVGKAAAAAETALDRLRRALDELPPKYRELLNAQLQFPAKIALSIVANQAPWFHALPSVADSAVMAAKVLKGTDKGGAPQMVAFRWLVLYLARAFAHATGRPAKVTSHPHRERFEGKFVNLVEEVLPLALRCCDPTADQSMPCPASPKARGTRVNPWIYFPRARNRGQRAISRTPH